MATNTTETKILTAAGKSLLAQLNATEQPLVIDKMIFANIPNRPDLPQPEDGVPVEFIVHEAGVDSRGRLGPNEVIYTSTLASHIGPFEFNWTGAYCSEFDVLVTIDHHKTTPKTADEPGIAGNTMVRSVVLEYKDVAEITNITVDASSYQYDANPRMKKMDDDAAQMNQDLNGKDWFVGDGFKVSPTANANNFEIAAGRGYVSGRPVEMSFPRTVTVTDKPSYIYIDAWREGTPTGEQYTEFTFVVSSNELDDYTQTESNREVAHFVCKLAEVHADGSVSDLKPEGEGASKEYAATISAKQLNAKIWPVTGNDAKVDDILTYSANAFWINGTIRSTDREVPAGAVITTINNDGNTLTANGVQYRLGGSLDLATAMPSKGINTRPLASLLQDRVSIKSLGVIGGKAIDNTESINNAFKYCRENKITAYVPDDEYRCDGTVINDSGGAVIFSQNAKLKRFAANSADQSPVYCVRGSMTESVGGHFETENDHPDGVLALGVLNAQDKINAVWWRCYRPKVTGVKKVGNISIGIASPQNTHGGNYANYFGHLENPIMRQCDEGLVFSEVANGHTVIAPQFYRCITAAISTYGAYGNTVVGGFLHSSDDGVIGINLRNRRVGNQHHSQANMFLGFNLEPGGASSKSVYVDTNCAKNVVNVIGNIAGGATILNRDNDIDTGYITSMAVKNMYGLRVIETDFLLGYEKTYGAKIKGASENELIDIYRIENSARHGAMIEITVMSHSPNLDRAGACRYLVSVQRQSGLGTEFEILSSAESSRNGAILEMRQEPDTGKVTVAIKTYNNGTSAIFNCDVAMKVMSPLPDTAAVVIEKVPYESPSLMLMRASVSEDCPNDTCVEHTHDLCFEDECHVDMCSHEIGEL